jgi:lysophospholipase L1-like esterase
MCQPPPYGPDAHPNNEGYMAIAEAVAANLPKSNW